MTILNEELDFYKSLEMSDAATNGGRISANKITTSVQQNVFGHVFKADRAAGLTTYRKIHCKVSNDADEPLFNPGYCLDGPTSGEDYVCFWPGTHRDTQADITGSERLYGSSLLKNDVTTADSAITVTVKHADLTGIFVDGDSIRVTNKATPDSGSGTEELHTISGTPSVAGLDVTITLSRNLDNDYAAADPTKVSSVYEPGVNLECVVDNWVETSASGTFDESTYPVITDNIGTIEQTWTLTMNSANTCTIVGDTVGTVATGVSILSDISPVNSDFSKPYFTLEAAAFGGTWANLDTIVWQTHPAAQPLWEKRKVPAGCASLANNKIIAIHMGESA